MSAFLFFKMLRWNQETEDFVHVRPGAILSVMPYRYRGDTGESLEGSEILLAGGGIVRVADMTHEVIRAVMRAEEEYD